jgi:hypothetical protein
MHRASKLLALAAATFAALLSTPIARAEVISVGPRDSAGLVAAIEYANRAPGEDVIELAPGSLYAVIGPAEGARALALPTVRSRIRILGNGAEIRRYSDGPLLLVAVAPSGSLRLEHLTLAEGSRGAIVNRGTLQLERVRVVDNSAHGAEAIIANYGNFSARGAQISYNQIAGAQRDAGIVLNYGRLDLADTTLEANTVTRRYRTLLSASAVLNLGEAMLDRVRIVGNAADDAPEATNASALVNAGNGRFDTRALVLAGNVPDSASTIQYVAD